MIARENVGEDRADDEVDLVALDQRLDLGDGDVGLEFVVLHDDFDLAAAELAAEVFHRELEAVAQLLAEHGGRAGQRGDDADLELVLSAGTGRYQRQGGNGRKRRESSVHFPPPNGNERVLIAAVIAILRACGKQPAAGH